VFEEVMGIPAHPLMVHAAVVFVPVLALLASAYAFAPIVRPHLRWVLAAVTVIAPITAITAKLSGDAFLQRLKDKGAVTASFLPRLEEHQLLGMWTAITTVLLALVTGALLYFIDRAGTSRPVELALRVAVGVLALVALYFVVRTGDSGAKAVWDSL
jgi:hypothetical protein